MIADKSASYDAAYQSCGPRLMVKAAATASVMLPSQFDILGKINGRAAEKQFKKRKQHDSENAESKQGYVDLMQALQNIGYPCHVNHSREPGPHRQQSPADHLHRPRLSAGGAALPFDQESGVLSQIPQPAWERSACWNKQGNLGVARSIGRDRKQPFHNVDI
jgi:hypothetical protein